MDKLFLQAEKEMMELKHPYVGTEHILLAFLKQYENPYLSYETYKKQIISVIGTSYKMSDTLLYTPIARTIQTQFDREKDAILYLLSNDNSIAYNLLVSMEFNIEEFYHYLEDTL